MYVTASSPVVEEDLCEPHEIQQFWLKGQGQGSAAGARQSQGPQTGQRIDCGQPWLEELAGAGG